ncbi:MAG TPA: hypothetical protein VFC63_12385 [Blastocatellia bacterium]|nr:hypothetical protein [Blastocatellia bacterium]
MRQQSRRSFKRAFRRSRKVGSGLSSGQAGMVLLILILALAVMMIAVTAALPNAKFEAKREREAELLARGNHLADAIERFRRTTNRYPLTMEELVDGITVGVKQVHFARPSAIKDPMTNGDWHLIRQGDPALLEFAEAWSSYTMQPIPPQLANLIGVQINGLNNGQPGQGQPGQPATGGGTLLNPNQSQMGVGDGAILGPFVGVSSTSKETSARTYYGLDEYDKWVFIYLPQTSTVPGVPIIPLQQAPGTGIGNPGRGGINGPLNPGNGPGRSGGS